MTKDFKLKLCDYGFVEEIHTKITKNLGTDGYKAPEIYFDTNEGYEGPKADFFALGVILFTMAFGLPPFTMATEENSYYRLLCKGS